jgi:uncharacterized protein YehS (DUF1456 family)
MNNYCLRRLRYALNLDDKAVINLFKKVNFVLALDELKSYLLKEDDRAFVPLPDYLLVIFLDGLICEQRGAREGVEPLSQSELVVQSKRVKLNNNMILNKIKIAFSLTTDSIIDILMLADFRISKSELSALFRNPTHRNYRECGNQLIRNFLTGFTIDRQKNFAKVQPKVKPNFRFSSKSNSKVGASENRNNAKNVASTDKGSDKRAAKNGKEPVKQSKIKKNLKSPKT